MVCYKSSGQFRWFYTGNQVGCLNEVGTFNFVSGGPPGSGLSAGRLFQKFFQESFSRAPWQGANANLSQGLLNASWPFIELQWIAEITITNNVVFRVSNRNIYVQDENGDPRYYEARVDKAPPINIPSGEWLSENFEIGNLRIVLNNRDGFYNRYLPQGEEYTQWIGGKVEILVGFGEKRSNYFTFFTGIIPHKKGVETTLEDVIINTYDKVEEDRVPIPTLSFDRTNFPSVDPDKIGQALPIIYGDWSTELSSEYGDIPAFCSNAEATGVLDYVWNISENSLEEIGDVFLHRGERSEDVNGPIKFINSVITKDPATGRVTIPTDQSVLEEFSALVSNARPGSGSGVRASNSKQDLNYVAVEVGSVGNNITITYTAGGTAGSEGITVLGSDITVQIQDGVSTAQNIKTAIETNSSSNGLVNVSLKNIGSELQVAEAATQLENGLDGSGGLNEIFAESTAQDFVAAGVKIGDVIVKSGTSEPFPTVTSVAPGQIIASSGVFTRNDTYSVLTDRYTFKAGDKVSVVCKGKDIEVMSISRLSDAGLVDIDPVGLSVGLYNDYWTADNVAQKVYHVSFDNKVLQTFDFVDIDPNITEISGIAIQTDGSLWLFDRPLSRFYRFILDGESVGKTFSTLEVTGLEIALGRGGPICIDDGNIITVHDQSTGEFYRINPFAGVVPTLVGNWGNIDFDPFAQDTIDISVDNGEDQILILDRNTNLLYRVNQENGALVSTLDLVNKVADTFVQGRGVGFFIDGTIFLLNKQDLSIYNYNEFDGANNNPGFIARDILQSYAGKSSFDFDLRWNNACRTTLANLKARVSIDSETNTLDFIQQFLQSYNTSMYLSFQKYSLFHITFDNFTVGNTPIREGDIKLKTFNPQKEYNQYFNAAFSKYKRRPFDNSTIQSDNYVSATGVQLADGKEIKKELDLSPIYTRENLDELMPLFVRLSAPEPEFVSLTVGFKFLFAQLNTFFNINFKDLQPNNTSGRRFDDVPSFVRKIQIDLDKMELKLKLWSLGTTQFGSYIPNGSYGGGENDPIILTNLGTVGYVAPVGDIVSSSTTTLDLADADGQDAETRSKLAVGNAWLPNFKIGIYSGVDHTLVEAIEIDSVSGSTITLKEDIVTTVENTIRNTSGFISGGHYIKYLNFNNVRQTQQVKYGYYCRPIEGYPTSSTEEIESQRSGSHSFNDGRLPYVLHPVDFALT